MGLNCPQLKVDKGRGFCQNRRTMVKINSHFSELSSEYIFPVIEKKLENLKAQRPDATIVNFGVGDIALPIAPTIVQAVCHAMQEMGEHGKFRGYGPGEGYAFLREAIAKELYAHLLLAADEIFISDGINSDILNILDLFDLGSVVALPNPTYPAYLSANILAGRSSRIVTLPCTKETGFVPKPPKEHCDLIYLCSPNNPTGVAMTRADLADWVAYAKKEQAILLYDSAYSAFITSPGVPKSIFEIEGAKEVAIEFCSFSKSAGFTGLRCAYTVLPHSVRIGTSSLNLLWKKRQSIKFNGVAYPIQHGALAALSPEGKKETQEQVASYLAAAKILREGLERLGQECYGGKDSPYIWWKTPEALSSWDFFDRLLENCHLISIPGKGFGSEGEGYVRLSAFTTEEMAKEAISRIEKGLLCVFP